MVSDKKAEELKAKGLYRRAASRWLEVFDNCDSEAGREWIRSRRNQCLAKRVRAAALIDTFGDVTKAAGDTQRRMGLARPGGEAFRLKTK
ncbi:MULTISPECIES: PerC family transcriptional regulator [unclassified Pantoea]|uniref:PerC family transcriptional regulator n=1 Tax=unclassified Pantoea TaxID=2630326 RepID=UPI0024773AC5|nr:MULTISPECIES: PerC family transcriptional regulator [unclassified Pantoea]GME35439.1 PerC family transcriptional regulator [Pantoea sp. QMID3]GME35564.1 PerC family transcriptional regulator [Pantoea sp. QMID1]GME59663.1 PerC family transcriptional regulator [Pantoea sp. QMID4]GME61174.1 PerC family transcriptional regulator [Pantoea sp. QMID2]